jgi:hypothetical protein
MSEVFGKGKGGGGHHHHHGGWGGTPWAGWGRYGDPYAYEPDYFADPIVIPVILNPDGTHSFLNENGEIEKVDVLGAIDTGAWQRQMNTIKQVPVSVARIMLRSGQDAITRAQAIAAANNLPGDTARQNVKWKLAWHAESLANQKDPNAMYSSGDDLKKWALAAYVEANAAEEGAYWIAQAWSAMWSEIGAAIRALPVQIAQEVNKTAGALLGLPIWAIVVGAVGVVGLGVAVYSGVRASKYGR